jgi:hypothetical protein
MLSTSDINLFFVRRNKNRNEVHYALRIDPATGKPPTREPVFGYWQMHEKGAGVTEPITVFEQMAFGIESQNFAGDTILLKLRAFPERVIRIAQDAATGQWKPLIRIFEKDCELSSFYVFAEDTLFLPKVKYIEVHGKNQGAEVTERINKG